ncbi:LysR substrate-binding domain-containing protein [Shimia marina]|uniref:Gcv operon activator n=1 Tax=Shimia marina TaxID=321267 RepID=A0A0P1FFW9_9RHOB|nr:LysR substrate-binding domain-containing protein [Shimia marina]CUH52419.1 Gcv operon activator [Shimia marina]SFE11258.1 LysR family transcriptional regulator, glycine cleavage system transcriptional activator [Shimia marina]
MSRNLPPLNALRAFEAAGRHESFSKAAGELNVAHSAISRHVRGLEARLGVKLFRDLPRGVALTPEGKAYLERMIEALDLIAEATEDLADTPVGKVVVNSEAFFAERFIVPRLGRFYAAYPEIDLRLETSDHLADVERYEADLAVRFAHSGVLSVPCDRLSDARVYPYAAPEVAQGISGPEDLLHVTRYRDRRDDLWRAWFEGVGVVPIGVPEADWRLQKTMAYEATLNGLGVLLCSEEVTAADVARGRLVKCCEHGLTDGAFFLVHGSRGVRRAAVRAFQGWLLGESAPFRAASS